MLKYSVIIFFYSFFLILISNNSYCQISNGIVQQHSTPEEDWIFIDNGMIKLGVIQSSGAGVAWFSKSGSTQNYVNHWDRGRLVQQSYYGKKDGSLWNKKPWRWNPVQGGDWKGASAQIIELSTTTTTLYAKTIPKHWASGEDLHETVMEQTITLDGNTAHIHYKFIYSGIETHPIHDQEIPAVFINPEYSELVLYDGNEPWKNRELHRSVPGWPNESRNITENWAAYVNEDDIGMGVYVPVSNNITCYRFGNGRVDRGSCSYFSPLTRFSVTPGFTFEYDLYITHGKLTDIRNRFYTIHDQSYK